MTTAVLAGLTLGGTNNQVVAHADTVNSTSTCPAPNAVSSASDAVTTAQSAVDAQQKAVNAAQSAVASASTANEGVNKLNDAITQRTNAQNAQKSAASQYSNVDLPAEKAAKTALDEATNKSYNASQAAEGAQARIDDATKNKLPLYQGYIDQATALQKKLDDAKAAWQPVNDALVAKQQEVADYEAKQGTPNFDQDHLDKLQAEAQSLLSVANPLYTKYQAAKSEFDDYMDGNTMQDLQDKLANAKTYIAGQQKLIDTAKSAHEAYVTAKANYDAALAKSEKSFAAMNDNSAITKAQNLINQIRKDYNIPTNATLKNLKDNKIPGDKNGLKQAQDAANANEDYVKATKDFPKALKEDQQKLTDAQKKADDLKAQDKTLNDQIDAKKASIKSLQAQLDAAAPADKGALATKLGDAQYELNQLKSQLDQVDGEYHDLTKENGTIANLKTDIHSLQVNLDAITNSDSFKALQKEINKWQGWLDTDTKAYEDGLANSQAANTLINAQQTLNDAQNVLAQLQKTLSQKQADYNTILKAYNECKGSSDQGNTGSNTGNQGNQGNAGNQNQGTTNEDNKTANAGHNSNATVKTSQKSVAATSAKAVTKKNAATTAKAKKLPQTGNDSAAVVALGALSGMLGLGLAAKKREF